MGLDMYLKAERYVSGFNFNEDTKEKKAYDEIVKLAVGKPLRCQRSPSLTVKITVAYWRKANAIHKWFVDKVQGGVDECQLADVSREQLQELVNLCQKTLESIETVDGNVNCGTTFHESGEVTQDTRPGKVVVQQGLAAELLPTQSGFFFGSTDYDDGYLQDLEDTIAQLKPLLEDPAWQNWDFYYQSSW